MIEVIKKENYKITNWSGGTTTEIFIWPQNAEYASREFDFRISSATVEEETSTFTILEKVKRSITVLEGKLDLTINDEREVVLRPYRVCDFNGEDHTVSQGLATDFNLMVKHGQGSMKTVSGSNFDLSAKHGHMFVYCSSQEMTVIDGEKTIQVMPGECLHARNETERIRIYMDQEAPAIIVEVKE